MSTPDKPVRALSFDEDPFAEIQVIGEEDAPSRNAAVQGGVPFASQVGTPSASQGGTQSAMAVNAATAARGEARDTTHAEAQPAAQPVAQDMTQGTVHAPAQFEAQPIAPMWDEKRSLFYAMRQLAWTGHHALRDDDLIFYRQAEFMRDYEDDETRVTPYGATVPHFQQMGYGQLRTYFSWRTRVRRGEVTDTGATYMRLYLFELINNIGVANPQEGLEQLVDAWQRFRVFDRVLDKLVPLWLKDYHVVYPLAHEFADFARTRGLLALYPAVFGYESDPDDSFGIFVGLSKYDIRKSVFYADNAALIHACFYFVLTRFREYFDARGKCFEDYIFYPITQDYLWKPFAGARFHPARAQHDRQVIFSKREVYTCRAGCWTYTRSILTTHGKQLIGYVMKAMESALRRAVGYRHSLSANPNLCDAAIHRTLADLDLALPAFIQTCVTDFYAQHTRRVVRVDVEALQQIRREALQTQDKLILPEGIAAIPPLSILADELESALITPGTAARAPLPTIAAPPSPSPALAAPPVPAPMGPDMPASASPAPRGWEGLSASLSAAERQALRSMAAGQDLDTVAAALGVMAELLADGINQKAMAHLGDTLFEVEGEVFPEYRENFMKMVDQWNS